MEVLSSAKIILMFNSLAREIIFSNVFGVTSPCESIEEIIVCWVKPYSSEKYENASWKVMKSVLHPDNSVLIFVSSKFNSWLYIAALDW